MQTPDLASTGQYIAWYAGNDPETIAIVENDALISYRRMAADLAGCVRVLEALGVRPGMVAGVEFSPRYPHLLLLLACETIGAATTSLAAGQDDDVTRLCDVVLASGAACHPRTVVVPHDFVAGLTDGEAFSPGVLERDAAPDQLARIVRTSGSTGKPKAMAVSRIAQQRRAARGVGRVATEIPPKPRFLCLYGLTVPPVYWRVLGVLRHGGTVLFTVGRFAWPLIAAGAVDYAMFTVGDAERTIQNAQPPPPGHALYVHVFGAAVTERIRQQVLERLHTELTNVYATNETSTITTVGPDGVGTPCEGVEIRIVDASGRDLPFGETGMIRIRSDTMMLGYLNDAADPFIDGWFQTGDIGIMPAPGKLIVLGRADDMLNIGGVKVPPAPIEAELKLIDDVSDAIVTSVTSANGAGTLLVAIEAGPEAWSAIEQRARATIARYVGVFEIMRMDNFPRTETGKIKRPEIEAAFRR